MLDLEDRLKRIEDRQALQDVLHAYCTAIDTMTDLDGLMECFTEDAVFDATGIGLPRFEGQVAIRGFFAQVFGDMTHHAHYTANFAIDKLENDEAFCRNYAIGNGRAKDGRIIEAYVRYYIHFVRTPSGWKIKSFGEDPLMPLPEEVIGVHGRD
jgi:ketosteroid isomerase-like protein